MLEIIALIYLTQKIGAIAVRKNLSISTWKLFTVLAWIGAEFLGITIGISILGLQDYIPLYLLAFGCAYTSYVLLHRYLSSKPDYFDDIDSIGQNQDN